MKLERNSMVDDLISKKIVRSFVTANEKSSELAVYQSGMFIYVQQ